MRLPASVWQRPRWRGSPGPYHSRVVSTCVVCANVMPWRPRMWRGKPPDGPPVTIAFHLAAVLCVRPRAQGGGECYNAETCKAATGNSLGSSKYFPAAQVLPFFNDPDPATNPDLWDWNHAYMQCECASVCLACCLCAHTLPRLVSHVCRCATRRLHAGSPQRPAHDRHPTNLWPVLQRTPQRPCQCVHTVAAAVFALTVFVFFFVLCCVAVLADLNTHHGLTRATDIVVSGDSAGGIGVWALVPALCCCSSHPSIASPQRPGTTLTTLAPSTRPPVW